jgi:general secretion pathway protein I
VRTAATRAHLFTQGFTLVEVLVALAVLAIALAAVLRAMGQAIDVTTDLRERTLALWAAQERATEHQLNHDWPAIDTKDGTLQFGEREWRWHEKVTKMPLEQFTSQEMRRIEIEVRKPNSPDVLGRIVLYLRKPPS